MKTIVPILYLSVFAMMLSCSSGNDEEKLISEGQTAIPLTSEQVEKSGIQFGQLSMQRMSITIEARGYIDLPPDSRAAVSPYFAGYIQQINVIPGDKVVKGDHVFTLSNPQYIQMQQEYLEVKSQLEYLQLEYQRQETLVSEQIASAKQFKKAEADYQVMLAKYEGLRKQLELLNISLNQLDKKRTIQLEVPVYAPITGIVDQVNATKGSFIIPADVALEIINVDHVHLELEVYEKDALRLKEGQHIQYYLPEAGEEVFYGSVHLVGKSLDMASRTVQVHGHPSEEDEHKFIPGMFVNAKIEIASDSVWAIPIEAVVETDEAFLVGVLKNEKNSIKYVEVEKVMVGRSTDTFVEVVEPEKLIGKTLVITGAQQIL